MKLAINPYAATWPEMGPDKASTLAADIQARGLQIKMLFRRLADGSPELLDGRNRLAALTGMQASLDINGAPNPDYFELRQCTDEEAKALIHSLNKERRHMTDEALRMQAAAGASVEEMMKDSGQSRATVKRKTEKERAARKADRDEKIAEGLKAGKTQRQVADEIGVTHQTVSNVAKKAQSERNLPKPAPKPLSPKKVILYATMQAAADHGATVDELSVRHNVSQDYVQKVLDTPLPASDRDLTAEPLPASAQEKLDAHRRRLEKEFDLRVRMKVEEELVKHTADIRSYWNKELKGLADKLKFRIGVMTKAEFNAILRVLHSDVTPTVEMRNEAFRIFNSYKLKLLSEKEMPMSGTLPKTVEEMRARRTAKR